MDDLRARGVAALFAALPRGYRLGVAVFDRDLRLVIASPSVPALNGLPAGDHAGRTVAEVLPPVAAGPVEAALIEVRDGERDYRWLPRLGPGEDAAYYRAGCYRLGSPGAPLLGLLIGDATARVATDDGLRVNRERLAMAERMAGVGAWTWLPDPEGWTWSDALFHLAGLTPSPTPPSFAAWLGTIAPESREPVIEATRAARAGRPFDIRFRQRRPDGSERVLRGWAEPSVVGGVVERIDGGVQDVTDVERAAGQQQAIAELGRAALAGEQVEALMDRAAAAVAAALHLDHVSVLEVQDEDAMVIRAVHGWNDFTRDGEPHAVRSTSMGGHALRTGRPVLVEDWDAETRFLKPQRLDDAGIRSGASVVVAGPDGPYGVLSVHSPRVHGVAEEDLGFLRAVANVLGNAVERLRLEEELSEQAAARGRLVAQALDAEDRTRREISETLHDGPLQDLLALNQRLARLEVSGEREAAHLERARSGLAHAITAVRDAMLELHPVVLDVGGLESALGAVAAQQGQAGGFTAEVRIDPEARGGVRDELILSLARELLVNAAKHARAGRVQVSVRRDADTVVLEVADDGCGLPDGRLQDALLAGHIGLASTRQRVEAVDGWLTVDGRPGEGTRVTAVLPVGPTGPARR